MLYLYGQATGGLYPKNQRKDRMRTLIRGGWVVGYKEPTHTLIPDGVVVFEDDRIVHVGKTFEGTVDRQIDAADKLVSPGFIDTHVHSGHRASHRLICDVGRPDYLGQPFLDVSMPREGTRIGGAPRYDRSQEPEARNEVDVWSRFTIVDLLRNGTTTFLEFGAAVHIQEGLLAEIERFGIRGYLGPGYDIGRPVGSQQDGHLIRVVDEAGGRHEFEQAVAFVKRVDGSARGLVHGALVPREVEACSIEQLQNTVQLAHELHMPVAIHAAYNYYEFYDVLRQHLKTPIELLESLSLLQIGPMVNIGHGNLVAENPRIPYSGGRDIEIMGQYGCTVSHCPVNIIRRARFLDSWESYTKAGINMTLGTDTYPRDMIMQMRMASYMGKLMSKNLSAAAAAEVYAAATLGGARSLGRSDLGRLAPGAKADIILIQQAGLNTLRVGPVRDPIKSLVECGISDDVDTVIVDGVVRMENRVIPGLDMGQLQTDTQAAAEHMWNHWQDWDPQYRTAGEVSPWSFPLTDGES
jgi:cytosine/adenosine deaminase-related metal-dependent hydrolase